jgi:hypothetical protein
MIAGRFLYALTPYFFNLTHCREKGLWRFEHIVEPSEAVGGQ